MAEFAKPGLYDQGADGRATLKGMRCNCGRTAFPYQPFGCEQCGNVATVAPADLRPDGVLVAAVEVHLHPGENPKPPFMVGAIKLDSGPMVRAYLEGTCRPGDRMEGILVSVLGEGEKTIDFRFAARGHRMEYLHA